MNVIMMLSDDDVSGKYYFDVLGQIILIISFECLGHIACKFNPLRGCGDR